MFQIGIHQPFVGRFGFLRPDHTLGFWPYDDVTDAHPQVRPRLEAGEFDFVPGFAEFLSNIGHSGAWSSDSSEYSIRFAMPDGRSLLSHVMGYLFAAGALGVATAPTPEVEYPSRPDYESTWRRMMEFGLVIGTTPNGIGPEEDPSNRGKRWYVIRYWQNNLTYDRTAPAPAQYDEPFLMQRFGVYRLPELFEITPEAQDSVTTLEVAVAKWGLAWTTGSPDGEAMREEAGKAYIAFKNNCVPGPGTEDTVLTPGGIFVNPRYVFNRGNMVESWINASLFEPNPSNAAFKCQGLARLVGKKSLFDAFVMQTQTLYENDWRSVLGLPLNHAAPGGSPYGIGGRRY